ncbi:MAG: nucleotidyltransferase domain-containing protein, partial [Candidatus Heimdallarchaeaceae archaeon]
MTFEDDVDNIVEMLKEATIKKFGQEIDLIAIYGSRARGTHEPTSDLELFVLVDKREKTNAEWFFVYKDIPVDLWSKEWESIEKITKNDPSADGGAVLVAGSIVTCKVIYYKDEETKNRFEKCREELKELSLHKEINLENANKYFNDMYKFLGKIYFAKEKQDLVEARNNAWFI